MDRDGASTPDDAESTRYGEAGGGADVRDGDDAIDATSGSASDATSQAGDLEDGPAVVVETTSAEEAALQRARTVSDLLDEAVRVPGTDFRVGLDPVLGVVSGYGDAVAAAISLYPVFEAYRLDAPKRTLAKMLTLVAIDFAVGSIPVVGTVFDAVWKANEWNVQSLERHLEGV